MNKGKLAITLSKLKTILSPDITKEQYQTESEIAAEVLWFASMQEDIKNKVIADFGCGNGILGIAALLLGAKKVFFVDSDNNSLVLAKDNIKSLDLQNAVFLRQDISEFKEKVDVVVQNPPFGVQTPHADRPFLQKAMQVAKTIYSFHKLESKDFIKALTEDNGFKVKVILKFQFPLKKTQKFHKKKTYIVDVGCWKIVKA